MIKDPMHTKRGHMGGRKKAQNLNLKHDKPRTDEPHFVQARSLRSKRVSQTEALDAPDKLYRTQNYLMSSLDSKKKTSRTVSHQDLTKVTDAQTN